MKLKIESDGTSAGTVITTESGEVVGNAKCLRFRIDAGEPMARATVEFVGIPIKFVGEVKVKGLEDEVRSRV